MSRSAYAPAARHWEGVQTAYTAGLSHFPDEPMIMVTPMGDYLDDGSLLIGTAIGGPVGGAVTGATTSVIRRWFGGSAVDQQRQERVNYVAQQAVNDNVAAAQLLLGGPSNVSGNEQDMWQTAIDLVRQANPDVIRDAELAGPAWLVNSGDTATNYPAMKRFIQAWATSHPITSVVGAVTSTVTDFFNPPTPQTMTPGSVPMTTAPKAAGLSPVVLIGIAGVIALAMSKRRR